MKFKVKMILIIISLFFCNCIYSGWVVQSSSTNYPLYSVFFIDHNTGWAVGPCILKTTNGGTNWFVQFQDTSTYHYHYSVFFLDQNLGWSVGGQYGYGLKTTNGGLNWITMNTNNTMGYNRSVYFVNQNVGYIVGDSYLGYGERITRTTDGGLNWISTIPVHFWVLYGTYFTDVNTGWAVGDSTYIIKTTNGGINWSAQFGDPNGSLRSVNFINSNTGWAVGGSVYVSQGLIIKKTTDGGANWVTQNSEKGTELLSVKFVNQNTGWAVGINGITAPNDTGIIIKTTNGGINWFTSINQFSGILFSVCFVDPNTGWAVGNNGLILKTTDGGNPIGIQTISQIIPKVFLLDQNYPNPFNPSTVIRFHVTDNKFVKLTMYDVLGREVATLVDQQMQPGSYSVDWDGTNYPSGVYFYKLVVGDNYNNGGEFAQTKKMLLIK